MKLSETPSLLQPLVIEITLSNLIFLLFSFQQSRVSGCSARMPIPRPYVQQMYNLFHPTDPIACRIEPLLSAPFSRVPPVNVSRYTQSPLIRNGLIRND